MQLTLEYALIVKWLTRDHSSRPADKEQTPGDTQMMEPGKMFGGVLWDGLLRIPSKNTEASGLEARRDNYERLVGMCDCAASLSLPPSLYVHP